MAPTESKPTLVVLIPALNEQETIGHVIREVPREIAGVGCVEVVVVDDGSEDLTTDRAWAAGVDHVARHPGNRGLVAAVNRGATEALARGVDAAQRRVELHIHRRHADPGRRQAPARDRDRRPGPTPRHWDVSHDALARALHRPHRESGAAYDAARESATRLRPSFCCIC